MHEKHLVPFIIKTRVLLSLRGTLVTRQSDISTTQKLIEIGMIRFLPFCLTFLLFVNPGWGAQSIGKALDEAMKSQQTLPIEEVIQLFQNAIEKTTNPGQKRNVLGLLADFLMEKHEWNKAVEVDERIIKEGTSLDRAGAYYNMAHAYLLLNQPEKAKAVCAELKANNPDSVMKEFSRYMKEVGPASVHAKLSEFLAAGLPL